LVSGAWGILLFKELSGRGAWVLAFSAPAVLGGAVLLALSGL
jgi:hypothetical protein